MAELYHENIQSEGLLGTNSFWTQVNTFTDSTHQLDSTHSWLSVLGGSNKALILPDSTTIRVGTQYFFANDTTNLVDVSSYDSTSPLTVMGPGGRGTFFMDRTNTVPQGHWIYQITSPNTQASYSIFGYYGGNALAGRWLEIYPGEGSNTAPYIAVANLAIVALTLGCTSIDTGAVGVYLLPNETTPVATATLTNQQSVVLDGLFIPVTEGARIAIKVNAGSDSLLKPYLTVYFTGV